MKHAPQNGGASRWEERTHPVNPDETDGRGPENNGEVLSSEASLKRRLQGVLLFRLLLAVFFLTLTLIVQSQRAEDLLSGQLRPLYTFSVILFAFTIIAAVSLNRVRRFRRFAYLQVFFDVGAVTCLIYLSGGVESIYSFLYMPAIVSGALLLYRRGSLVAASACALSYGLLLDLQYFGWVAPLRLMGITTEIHDTGAYFHSLLMNIAGFYLTAYLAGYLAEAWLRSTQQVREQKRDLKHLEMLHRNIIQSLSSGLLMISPKGEILFANDAAQKILALPLQEISGQLIDQLFSTLKIDDWPRASVQPRQNDAEAPVRKEFRYNRPTGETLCLGYSVSLMNQERGEAWGWVFIFQDLTHLRAMEEHLQRTERMAQAGKMVAEIAHEIRNPLAAISGAAQMLQHELAQEPFQVRLMTIIGREVRRIDDLISDFLWMAKGSQKSARIETVSLVAIVDEVLAELRAREMMSDGHRVERVFEVTPTFQVDPLHLRQVLWQIMANGLEAMPQGGLLTIRVTGSNTSDNLPGATLIEISDTGCGIAEENRPRIFEPFFTSKNTGTGLGLSIVYQLMENLGGHLEINSDGQSGTVISLFFPFPSAFSLANQPSND